MTTWRLPPTAAAAVKELGLLGELAFAIDWKKAAILTALVGPSPGYGGDRTMSSSYPYSTVTLTALGITGIRSRGTVVRYRNEWMKKFGFVPALGANIELPDEPFPEHPDSESAREEFQLMQEAVRAKNSTELSALLDECTELFSVFQTAEAEEQPVAAAPAKKAAPVWATESVVDTEVPSWELVLQRARWARGVLRSAETAIPSAVPSAEESLELLTITEEVIAVAHALTGRVPDGAAR